MKAPDKIYVNFPYGEEHPWCGPMVTKQGLNRHDTIYIRKDALLEWLKMAVGSYSHPDTVNKVDKIRCEGKKWAFQDVINKIESL